MTEQSIFDTLQLLLRIIDDIYTETYDAMLKNPESKEIHEKIEKAMVRVINNFESHICDKYHCNDKDCTDKKICPLYKICYGEP